MITIYTIAWNEEIMLPHFIFHYTSLFPTCKIVVCSNESTDRTERIAKENGCEVRVFKTGGKLSDRTYLDIKNNWWREATTDWVLIADVDEHLYIHQGQLIEEEKKGVTIIKSKGFNMVSDNDDQLYKPLYIKRGVRSESYDKLYLFNKRHIQEINYLPGCHKALPKGNVHYSHFAYPCRHYKYYNLPYMIERHAKFSKRLSEDNIKRGYGGHYLYSAAEITKEFNEARKNAVIV